MIPLVEASLIYRAPFHTKVSQFPQSKIIVAFAQETDGRQSPCGFIQIGIKDIIFDDDNHKSAVIYHFRTDKDYDDAEVAEKLCDYAIKYAKK